MRVAIAALPESICARPSTIAIRRIPAAGSAWLPTELKVLIGRSGRRTL
jgi:hypothetical protein